MLRARLPFSFSVSAGPPRPRPSASAARVGLGLRGEGGRMWLAEVRVEVGYGYGWVRVLGGLRGICISACSLLLGVRKDVGEGGRVFGACPRGLDGRSRYGLGLGVKWRATLIYSAGTRSGR